MHVKIRRAVGVNRLFNTGSKAFLTFSFIFLSCLTPFCLTGIACEDIREPDRPIVRKLFGAGKWFPSKGRRLKKMVDSLMENAECQIVKGRVIGAISPHAGYIYSGKVAGYTFRAIRENAKSSGSPETVVILGLGHRGGFPGVALMDGDFIKTPLGPLQLDKEAAEFLCSRTPRIFFDYRRHIGEHSAENEIPFVQVALPDAKVVVGIMGDHCEKTIEELVEALINLAEAKAIMVIASSDMMHSPDHDLVSATDRDTLEKVKELDYLSIRQSWSPEKQNFCGIGPVLAAIRFSKRMGCNRGLVLDYGNSGDYFPSARGQWVVGYCSVVFVRPE